MTELCPVCKSSNVLKQSPYRATHPTFEGLNLSRCDSCTMVFASPMPDSHKLDVYNSSYFDSAHGGKTIDPIANAFFSAIAKLRIAYIEQFLLKNNIIVSRVLELGPGPGYFAGTWNQRHQPDIYYALETDSSCHKRLKDIGVTLVNTVDDIPAGEEVDMIVMSHVLEHVSEPHDFLKQSVEKLKVNGVLFIEVPCSDWKYKSMDEPHLLFFDKKPLSILLSSLGFEKITLNYYGPNIKKSLSHPGIRNAWMKIRSKLIGMGIVKPFGIKKTGMEPLSTSMERAAISPFKAYRESPDSSWWLRGVAVKSEKLRK